VGRVERPDRNAEIASDLSIAFLVLLERLAPEERAAFLLRDVFEVEYREIAEVLGKSEPASRQVVHRARERVRGEQRRFAVSETARTQLLQQFSAAVEARDHGALLELFAPDAVWTADGGGRGAGPRPIVGADRIARLVLGLANKFLPDGGSFDLVTVNGETGLAFRRGIELIALIAVETDGERLQRVYAVVNPEKLGGAVTATGPEPSSGHETTQ
jgi:RNA polymerase sigma-70 factor (ECF subfamily)